MRIGSLKVLAALLVAFLAAAPVRAEPDGFASAGGPCIQGAVALTAPSKNVRAFVPDDFPLVEAAGTAALFAYTVACDDNTIDDGPAERIVLTGVAAFVFPPDGRTGVEIYDIFMTSDSPAFYEAVTGLGLHQGLVDVGYTIEPIVGPIVKIRANTPWSFNSYRWQLLAVKGPAAGVPFPSVHWQDGTQGRVRIEYAHSDLNLTPGIARLTAAAGSPLAEMLGTETVTGAGAILRFSSYSATTQLTA